MYGTELEAVYRTETSRFIASHSVTKLIDFKLLPDYAPAQPIDLAAIPFNQGFNAAPYGFGNDLANQSPHLTKLAYHLEIDDR